MGPSICYYSYSKYHVSLSASTIIFIEKEIAAILDDETLNHQRCVCVSVGFICLCYVGSESVEVCVYVCVRFISQQPFLSSKHLMV